MRLHVLPHQPLRYPLPKPEDHREMQRGQGYVQLVLCYHLFLPHTHRRLLATGNYDQVIFSYDSKKKTLGTNIYSPADEVKNYIYQAIVSLEELS